MSKLFELSIVKGYDQFKVLGRLADVHKPMLEEHEYKNGHVYNLIKESCPGNFYYHHNGRVFVAHRNAKQVPESYLNKYKNIGGKRNV